MGRAKDLSGIRFGKLVAIERLECSPNQGYYWLCECDCGNTTKVTIGNLGSGHIRSCGCLGTAHPLSGTPTHGSWKKMISRAHYRYEEYQDYYKDVTVCDRWNPSEGGSFANFVEDIGERPEGTSLNRVRGTKEYSPETCEWASFSMQSYDQKISSANTSGRTGVRWRPEREVWEARIAKDGKISVLYYGPSFEEAVTAREAAEIELYGFTKE